MAIDLMSNEYKKNESQTNKLEIDWLNMLMNVIERDASKTVTLFIKT